jgi:RNA polymerase sigma factor for flagellar operon FliA
MMLAALWEGLRSASDPRAREQLILHYASFARTVAAGLYRTRSDDSTPFEEYLQYARVGLMESIDRYDGSRGASFETFSSYRIRGAILNGLARETELGAQRSFWRARLAEREESIAPEAIQRPDTATFLDFVRLAGGIAVGLMLDDPDAEPADESPLVDPYLATEVYQARGRVRKLVETLPPRERQIIQQHYFEQREFQQIAAQLGITKGRVSQLHARAIERIREQMDPCPKLDRKL